MKHVVPSLAFACLALLLGLGSPGCGCGGDTTQEVVGKLQACCCTWAWTAPEEAGGRDVVVFLEGASEDLWPDVRPPLLPAVQPGEPATFQVCVDTTHPPGATVTMVLRDQDNGREYGRALVVYGEPCGPTIQPIGNQIPLRTASCGS